jgi:para-aminobenzoate synthetase/4-amino-4-deoxychorismate lyase
MNSVNRWHPLSREVYALVERTPASVLLEHAKPHAAGSQPVSSAEPGSLLFLNPLRVCVVNQPAELPGLFAEIERSVAEGLFAAGYFTYECGNCFEPAAHMRPGRPGQPLAWFGIYRESYRFDHRTGAFIGGAPPGLSPPSAGNRTETPAPAPPLETTFGLAPRQYAERIASIHEWIRAGDVYQLNFTAPLAVRATVSPAALYTQLSASQPVEYGAFLHCQPGRHILSLSPELFFRLEWDGSTRRIATRPMKGTAPRGRTTREDRGLAEWLRNDPKNRSENVMIVDLLRNDLGRLCNFGSVRVESLFAVERYRTLWQMTSTVTGEPRPEVDFQQIFRALFPCGSVTGAPKVRAMQLIAELEDQPRGIYTGSIGFFSRERTVFNVAIRTLELERGQGIMGIGSGIVIDSDAAEEFRECQLKAAFLSRPAEFFPGDFSLIETLLWHNGYPLLDLHLDRLEDSAAYFDLFCDRAAAKAALLAHAHTFATDSPRKVRLLLGPAGNLEITSEPLPPVPASGKAHPTRACIASLRTDPLDPMYFHKTTHRPVYAEAFQAATHAGFDEVLFLNTRGEVTEGAISNIFVEKEGRWFTPPVECGLLPGVYRRHTIETKPGIEERILHLEDLQQADAIYLANAVRGLRHAVVDWKSQSS